MENSVFERLKKLDAEREKLVEQAKQEALAKAMEGIAELNALGFHYELWDRGTKTKWDGRSEVTVIDKGGAAKAQAKTGPAPEAQPKTAD